MQIKNRWPYQTSMMELFCENRQQFSGVAYYAKKTPSEVLEQVAHTPLKHLHKVLHVQSLTLYFAMSKNGQTL